MRNKRPIDALLPKVRQAILCATLLQPERWWYLTGLAAHLGLRPSSLQRELASLAEAHILRTRIEGNRTYYQADPDCPFLADLQGLLLKTVGLADVLRAALENKKILVAFVFGSIARGKEEGDSDVDLLIIGDLGLREVARALRGVSEKIGREVNTHVVSPREYRHRRQAQDHFLTSVLKEPRIFVAGSEDELAGLAE